MSELSSQHYRLRLPSGIDLAYRDVGSGDPLLLVHGFTGTAMAHLESLMTRLSDRYRVIAPDLRGYGASQPPPRDFPVDFYHRDATDLAGLLDALDVTGVTPMGYSDGAETVLILAARRPDLVRGVVAWGVSGIISKAMVDSVQDWLPVSAWGPEREEWRDSIIRNHGEEQLESLISGWVQAAANIHAAGGDICLSLAPEIGCPVLILNGSGEVGNTPEDVAELARRIPECRLEIVQHSGHPVHRDQPELFFKLVEDFLDTLRK